jgi:hypothetical protein
MRSTFLSRTSGAAVAATIGLLAISLFSGLSPQQGYAGKVNGGGGGGGSQANYDVWVVDDVLWSGGTPRADLYAPGPGCPGDTPGGAGNYAVQMLDDGDDAGNSCGIVQLFDPGAPEPNGYELRDNVGFRIVREKVQGKQFIIAVVLHGQESVGPDIHDRFLSSADGGRRPFFSGFAPAGFARLNRFPFALERVQSTARPSADAAQRTVDGFRSSAYEDPPRAKAALRHTRVAPTRRQRLAFHQASPFFPNATRHP